jgi:hypothetical protein
MQFPAGGNELPAVGSDAAIRCFSAVDGQAPQWRFGSMAGPASVFNEVMMQFVCQTGEWP